MRSGWCSACVLGEFEHQAAAGRGRFGERVCDFRREPFAVEVVHRHVHGHGEVESAGRPVAALLDRVMEYVARELADEIALLGDFDVDGRRKEPTRSGAPTLTGPRR